MGPHGIKQILKNLSPQEIAQLRNQLLSENVEQLGLSPDQVLGILQALEEEVPEPGSFLQGQPQAGLYPPRLADDVAQLLSNWTTIFGSNTPQGTAEGYQEMPRRKRFAEAMNVGDPEGEMMAIQERVDMLERERAHLLQQLHVTDQQTYPQHTMSSPEMNPHHPMASPDMNPQHVKRPRMDESFAFPEPGYQGGFEDTQAFTEGEGSGMVISQGNQQKGGKQNMARGNNQRKRKNRSQQQRSYQITSGATQDRDQDGGWEQHAGGGYSAEDGYRYGDQDQQSYNQAKGGKQTSFGRQNRGNFHGRGQGRGRGKQQAGRGRTQNKSDGRGRGAKYSKDRAHNRGKNRGKGKSGTWGGTGRDQTKRESDNQSERRRSRTVSQDRFHERPRSNERQIQDECGAPAQEGPDDYYGSRVRYPSGEDNMNPQDTYPDYGGESRQFKQDDYPGDDYIGFGDGDYRDEPLRDKAREDNRSYQGGSSHYKDDLRREEDWRDYQPGQSEGFALEEVYRDNDHNESGRIRKDSFRHEEFIKEGRDGSRRRKRHRNNRKRSRDEGETNQDNRRQSSEHVDDYQRDFVAKESDRRPSREVSRESGYAYDRPADTRVWDDVNAEIERRHWEDEMRMRQDDIERSVKMEIRDLRSHQSLVLVEPPRVSLSSPPGIFHSPPMIPETVSQRPVQFGDGLFPLPAVTLPSLLSIKTKRSFQRGRGRNRYTDFQRGRGQAFAKMSSTRARNIEELRQKTASRVTEELAKMLLKRPVEKLPKRQENKDEKKDEEHGKMESDAPKAKDSKETREGNKVAKVAEKKATPKEPRTRALMHQLKILETHELQGFLHLKVVSLGTCHICNTRQSTYEAYTNHTSSISHKIKMQNYFGPDSYNERERIVSRLRKLPFHTAFTPEQLKAYPQGDRVYFCSCCCAGYTCSAEEHRETDRHKHFEANRLQCTACNLYFFKLNSFRNHLQGELHKKISELLKTKGDKEKGPQQQQGKTDVPSQASVAKKVNNATAASEGPRGRNQVQQVTSKKPKMAQGSSAASSKSQEAVIKSSTVPTAKSSTQAVCTETDEDVVGLDLVIPVSGFFCKCCSKFYNDKFTAKITHCRTGLHKQKALEWYKSEGEKGDLSPSVSKKTQEVIVIDDDDDEDENKKSRNQEGNDKMETPTKQKTKPTDEGQDSCKQEKEAASHRTSESLEEGELMSEEELPGKEVKPQEMETDPKTEDHPEAMDVRTEETPEIEESKSLPSEKRDTASEVHLKATPEDPGSQGRKDSDIGSEQKQTGVGQQSEKSTDDVSQGDYLYGDLEEQTYQKEEDDEVQYLELAVGEEPRAEELGDLDDDEEMFAIDEGGWEIRSEEGGCAMTSDEEQAGDDGIEGDAGDDGIQGDAGDDGIQGDAGDDGIQGDAGDDGIQGDAGDDGIQGDAGDDGIPGDEGDDGKGDAGDDGKGDAGGDDGKEDDDA